jgi:hypothetical protein
MPLLFDRSLLTSVSDRAAAEIATSSQPIDMDALLTRLTSIQSGQDDSSELRRSPPSREASESTIPPSSDDGYLLEDLSYHELVQDGGRPVCAIEALLHAPHDPTASYESILPWLSDSDSTNRNGEIQTVFSRQLDRWWDFRKWQWGNRNIAEGDGGFSAFLAAEQRMSKRMQIEVSNGSLEQTALRLWRQKPELRLLSDDHGFPAYRKAVKRRLAPYKFSRPLQLTKNPRKQTEWSTWLEYLNFEQWWLERHTTAREPHERPYNQAWKRLFEAVPSLPQERSGLNSTKGNYNSQSLACAVPASGPLRIRQPCQNMKTVALTEQLASAQDELATAKKIISDFMRDTAHYRRAETAINSQKHRVQWVLKEARVMEAEAMRQRETAKNNLRSDAGESKKRRYSDDVNTSQSWSKKTSREGDGKDTVPSSGRPRQSQRRRVEGTATMPVTRPRTRAAAALRKR